MQRRAFLEKSLYAGVSSWLSSWRYLAAEAPPPKPQQLLILGGTFYLGPAVVEAALAAGHSVTLFNRGITSPDLFPNVEKLKGLRSSNPALENLSSLRNRHWDAVIDVWPNDPALAESAAKLLAPHSEHYLYVSSVAAYSAFDVPGIDETHPLRAWHSGIDEYGSNKAESERRLHAIVGNKLTIVRPGPIKGFRSYLESNDFMTWLLRFQRRDAVIGPGDGNDSIEIIDIRDVASFLIRSIDRRTYGAFNLTGKPMTFRQFLQNVGSATDSSADLVWLPADFLHSQGMSDAYFPFFRPGNHLYQISSQKAYETGWQTRPFSSTAFDALESAAMVSSYRLEDPLSAARTAEVISNWRSGAGAGTKAG